MPNSVTAAIAALPLKEMEASLLRSAILDGVTTLGLSEADFREAIDIASYLHRDQVRKQRGDMPVVHYIEHPLRNTLRAIRYGVTDADTLLSIVLHDTVEDSAVDFSQTVAGIPTTDESEARENAYTFLATRFGDAVAQIVHGLSNPLHPGGLSRSEKNELYLSHVREAIESPQVFVAKFVDFADNALSLHHSPNDDFVKRQATKYEPLVALFAERFRDDDVLALVGAPTVAQMRAQLDENRLEEFAADR